MGVLLGQSSSPRHSQHVNFAVVAELTHQMIGEQCDMAITVWESWGWRGARSRYVKHNNFDVLEGLHERLKHLEIGADSVEDEKRRGRSSIASSACHAQDTAIYPNLADLAVGAGRRAGAPSNRFWRCSHPLVLPNPQLAMAYAPDASALGLTYRVTAGAVMGS